MLEGDACYAKTKSQARQGRLGSQAGAFAVCNFECGELGQQRSDRECGTGAELKAD